MQKSHKYDRTDPASIEAYAQKLVGKSLREFLTKELRISLDKTSNFIKKGSFGQVLEEYFFGIHPGNESEPDFKEAGVELKSTPLKTTSKGLASKERLVLNIINYQKLVKEKWERSSFLRKNSLLLLIFYLHKDWEPFIDHLIKLANLWKCSPEDLEIIKDDWLKIQRTVKAGKAHELSEGDTFYLGACTKGKNRESLRAQPCSRILAKQRAFAYKQKYVNFILNELIKRKLPSADDTEKIIKNINVYRTGKSFEEIIKDKFTPYIGRSVDNLQMTFKVKIDARTKNYSDIITRAILGIKGKKIEEFEKADITLKSIVLERSGTLKESMSFPAFDYLELAKEKDWEASSLNQILEKRFFFVIYKKDELGDKILHKVMFWNMPFRDRDNEAKKVWAKTIKLIKDEKFALLPKISENKVCNVRPHGKDSNDKALTPSGKYQVKRCFWLNASYIKDQINTDETIS